MLPLLRAKSPITNATKLFMAIMSQLKKTFAMILIMAQLIRVEIAAAGMPIALAGVEIMMTETSMHIICAALAEV